jgi:hypothetical protein
LADVPVFLPVQMSDPAPLAAVSASRPDGKSSSAVTRPRSQAGLSPARVVVVDVGGEEFKVAPAGCVAGIGDERRYYIGVGRRGERDGRRDDGGKLVGHGTSIS